MSEHIKYAFRSASKDPFQAVFVTEHFDSRDNRVTFVRGGGTRHMCPICSNATDISRMSVTTPQGQVAHIYWCPKGHIYYAYQGFVGPLAMVDEINAATDERRCPICGYEYLSLDTQTMMEDYGEYWETILPTLDQSLLPYTCDGCGQEGSYEDFVLIARMEVGHD